MLQACFTSSEMTTFEAVGVLGGMGAARCMFVAPDGFWDGAGGAAACVCFAWLHAPSSRQAMSSMASRAMRLRSVTTFMMRLLPLDVAPGPLQEECFVLPLQRVGPTHSPRVL